LAPRPFPWLFPYVKERDPENNPLGVTVLRPLVEARLIGPGGREGTKVGALVDSGSSYTLCFDWMAQEVGIDPYDGPDMLLKIAGGLRRVFFADVTLRLCPPESQGSSGAACSAADGLDWSTPVGFIQDWADPPWLMVLGQFGFLDRFTVVMSRLSQALAIEDQEHFDERYGALIPVSGE
jgi:hypothetical protein